MPRARPELGDRDLPADLEGERLQQAQQLVGVPDALELQDVLEQVGRDQLLQVELAVLVGVHENDFRVRPVDQPHLQVRTGLVGGLHVLQLQLCERQQQERQLPSRERLAGPLREVEGRRAGWR